MALGSDVVAAVVAAIRPAPRSSEASMPVVVGGCDSSKDPRAPAGCSNRMAAAMAARRAARATVARQQTLPITHLRRQWLDRMAGTVRDTVAAHPSRLAGRQPATERAIRLIR